jgi:hypothetical protein
MADGAFCFSLCVVGAKLFLEQLQRDAAILLASRFGGVFLFWVGVAISFGRDAGSGDTLFFEVGGNGFGALIGEL